MKAVFQRKILVRVFSQLVELYYFPCIRSIVGKDIHMVAKSIYVYKSGPPKRAAGLIKARFVP